MDNLNSNLLLKIAEIFLKKYVPTEHNKIESKDFEKHKANLYRFFKDFSNHVDDYQVWRLVCRIKIILQENVSEIKEAKMNEILSLQKINWHVHLETCDLVERAMIELINLIESQGSDTKEAAKGVTRPKLESLISNEERAFFKTNAMIIEETF